MGIQRKTTITKRWRFFKSGLPSIVWNPKKEEPLADFMSGNPKGTFITEDPKIAQILKDKGYPEIPINAVEPPNYSVIIPGRSLGEGENMPLMNANINPALAEQRMKAVMGGLRAPEIIS